jgi:SAM-dependent methyltransferase
MDLPFPNDVFDAVLSCLVLNFVPEPRRAAEEMRRVTRTGGIIAACVWDYGGRMEMLRTFWDAAVALNPEAKQLDEGNRSPLCHPQNLAGLLRDARLSRVVTTHLDIPMEFANFDDYWTPFLGGQGPAGGYAMSLSEKDRQALKGALRSRLDVRTDGAIRLVGRAWAVRGIRE